MVNAKSVQPTNTTTQLPINASTVQEEGTISNNPESANAQLLYSGTMFLV